MKYPQLVSMPSTVQDWLDEQLEARGIDAVVYTRYIFSILQRDTLDLPDDLLTLSSSKSKEVGRRGRKRGRREEYWDVWDCEQLKRSAAVECLMSASDQKFGIEKLVDELCAKLKEIQSEGEDITNQTQPSVSESQRQSPSDQAQKYYAAFPPLSKCDDPNSKAAVVNTGQLSAWGSKKILSNSFGKNKQQIQDLDCSSKPFSVKLCAEDKENQGGNGVSLLSEFDTVNMKSINQENEKCMHCSADKELGFRFSWNMSAVWCTDGIDHAECVSHFDSIAAEWRVCKYNRQNRENMENIAATEEPLGVGKGMWNTSCCCYHNHNRSIMTERELSVENESVENCERESGQYVDENLAQLIAKFDHSIEALWSPETRSENASPEEKMDSESPLVTSQSVNADLCNSVVSNQAVSNSGNPFLHCGTNITNSIWSTHPPLTKALSSDEKVQLEQANASNHFGNGTGEKVQLELANVSSHFANGTDHDIEGKGDIGTPDLKLGNSDKVVGSKSATTGPNKASVPFRATTGPNKASVPFRRVENNLIAENMKTNVTEAEWNDLDSFPSTAVIPGLSKYTDNDQFKIAPGKGWPTADTTDTLIRNFPRYNMFPNCQKMQNSGSSDYSFGTLNHNKEDSSFTEVIPKHSFCKFSSQNKSSNVNNIHKHSDGLYQMASVNREKTEVPEKEKEEDLLTSTRTHFRPIRQENPDNHNNNNTACYADGTTFVIPNGWESVPFKRSESGALYLETDLGIETPKKYMEYKEKELYSARHKTVKSPNCSASLGRDFIIKFRVHQIEKCCQTEESEECVVSDEEIDTKRSRQDLKSLDSEFYFPGDEHFAEKVVNCLESDDEHVEESDMESKSLSLLAANNNASEIKVAVPNHSERQGLRAIGDMPMSSEEMSFRWSAAVKSCCKCSRNNFAAWENGWQKDSNGLHSSKDGIWGPSGAAVQSHVWNDIWSNTYDNNAGICRKCGDASKTSSLNMSPQHLKLREELSQDGEQLLSDLSYMQHLYQGSDSNDSVAGCVEKMQCLSPPDETSNDVQLYDDSEFGRSEATYFHSSPVSDDLHGKENESFEDFVASCTPKMLPVKVLLSMEVGTEKRMNERPFSLKVSAKDRKRRHSGCLRQISNNHYPENYNIGVQLDFESSAAMGYHLSSIKDSARWKGSCSSRSLRPVTL